MEQNKIKTLTGTVISDKMDKTAVVLFERKVKHEEEIERFEEKESETEERRGRLHAAIC